MTDVASHVSTSSFTNGITLIHLKPALKWQPCPSQVTSEPPLSMPCNPGLSFFSLRSNDRIRLLKNQSSLTLEYSWWWEWYLFFTICVTLQFRTDMGILCAARATLGFLLGGPDQLWFGAHETSAVLKIMIMAYTCIVLFNPVCQVSQTTTL